MPRARTPMPPRQRAWGRWACRAPRRFELGLGRELIAGCERARLDALQQIEIHLVMQRDFDVAVDEWHRRSYVVLVSYSS